MDDETQNNSSPPLHPHTSAALNEGAIGHSPSMLFTSSEYISLPQTLSNTSIGSQKQNNNTLSVATGGFATLDAIKDDVVKSNNLHVCRCCSKEFTGKENFNEHAKICEQSEVCYCYICKMYFSTVNDLIKHMPTHAGYDEFEQNNNKLSVATGGFATLDAIKDDVVKSKNLHVCRCCSKEFTGKENFNEHAKICEQSEVCYCFICKIYFSTVNDLIKHMLTHAGYDEFEEENVTSGSPAVPETGNQSSYPFFSKGNTLALKRTQQASDQVATSHQSPISSETMSSSGGSCIISDRQQTSTSSMIDLRSDVPRYKCLKCCECFQYQIDFQRHIQLQICEASYPCPSCGKFVSCSDAQHKYMCFNENLQTYHRDFPVKEVLPDVENDGVDHTSSSISKACESSDDSENGALDLRIQNRKHDKL